MFGRGNYTTSGAYWLRYRQESESRLSGLAGPSERPSCLMPGCPEPVRVRAGPGKGLRYSRYCVEHAAIKANGGGRSRSGVVRRAGGEGEVP